MIELVYLEEEAESVIKYARGELDKFLKDLKFKPSHAMGWLSDSAFRAAAQIEVWSHVLAQKGRREVPDEEVVTHFAAQALNHIVKGARWPYHSTSPGSNLMAEAVLRIWAELYVVIVERL